MLPESRKNVFHAAIFAFVAMFVFDYFTSGIGVWTWVTAITYAGLAVLFGLLFKRIKQVKFVHYIGATTIGVLIFDLITGPGLSTIIFHQPLLITILGQIPFTLMHLASAVTYTFFFVPLLDPAVRHEDFFAKIIAPFTNLSNWVVKWR